MFLILVIEISDLGTSESIICVILSNIEIYLLFVLSDVRSELL